MVVIMEVVLQHLTKSFPSRDRKDHGDVIAVNDFNLTIPDGKLIGLLGPSGCGKSTTLNLISGLLKPTSGRILFGEDDVTNLPPENRGIGLVFQNYALYPHLTVKQNILFPLENLKGKDKLTKSQMLDKAVLAAKLVLLLDEPLSNLDARLRLQTREEIRRIQRETGVTTVFVTHDQEEAMSISDLIVVMKEGVVQQIGKPQEVYDSPANLFVAKFLGTPPINLFEGQVKGGRLLIGGEAVLDLGKIPDQKVYAGVRPEGFALHEEGGFSCTLDRVEVMGRDISVVSANQASLNPLVRAIIGTENKIDTGRYREGSRVRFHLIPHKVYLFNWETEERIYFGER